MDPTKKGVLIICDILRKETLKMKLKALKKKRLWVRQWISRRNRMAHQIVYVWNLEMKIRHHTKTF